MGDGTATSRSTRGRRRWFAAPACAALVFAVALAARWSWGANQDGPNFEPKPDAVEYAASAMALAQTGRFYLQVGPVEASPHYSPGWPATLAAALALGADPRQVWRLTGLLGAALAVALGGTAGWAAAALHLGGGEPAFRGGLVASLLGGLGWALAPCAVAVGRTVLSDEPAACAAFAALLLLLAGLARAGAAGAGGAGSLLGSEDRERRAKAASVSAASASVAGAGRAEAAGRAAGLARAASAGRGSHPALWCGAAGLAFGVAAAYRPVEGVLLAAPALLLLACAARGLRSPRAWLPLAAAWCAGAAAPAALVGALLVRSGRSPFAWTGYGFWWPSGAQHLGEAFSWANAWSAEPALALLGLPGPPADWYLVRFWPLLAPLAAAWLWRAARAGASGAAAQVDDPSAPRAAPAAAKSPRAPANASGGPGRVLVEPHAPPGASADSRRRLALWGLAALAIWTLCRIVVFACYFASAARFFLPAQAFVLLLLAAALGLAAASGPPRRRAAGLAAAACLLATFAGSFASYRRQIDADPRARTYRAFNRWIQLADEERAVREVPFDPLDAQALGLLDPATVADIHQWGALPPTYHVRRLRKKGLLPP
jgi:hypothetical protein